jgi:hypothetical protein
MSNKQAEHPAVADYRAGLPVTDIIRKHKISTAQLYPLLDAAGVPRRFRTTGPDFSAYVGPEVTAAYGTPAFAELLEAAARKAGRKAATVYDWLRRQPSYQRRAAEVKAARLAERRRAAAELRRRKAAVGATAAAREAGISRQALWEKTTTTAAPAAKRSKK